MAAVTLKGHKYSRLAVMKLLAVAKAQKALGDAIKEAVNGDLFIIADSYALWSTDSNEHTEIFLEGEITKLPGHIPELEEALKI